MDLLAIDRKFVNKIKNNLLTEKDIFNFIINTLDYLELHDYLKEVKIINEKSVTVASYNFYECSMKLNLKMAILNAKLDNHFYKDIYNETLMINLNIINSIIHEFVHVIQNYVINETNWSLAPMLKNQIDYVYSNDNDDQYNNHYSDFTFEREAISESFENTIRLIYKYLKDYDLYEYYINLFEKFLINGYVDNTYPIKRLYNEVFKIDHVPEISGIDDYTKIKYGFYVPYSTVTSIINDDTNIKKLVLNKKNKK